MADHQQTVRDMYTAYTTVDRDRMEQLLSSDYTFFSPHDDGIDRATYWERCWPNPSTAAFELVRLIADGGEVVVTYEATRTDGTRFRNTEIHTLGGEQVVRTEVYFGWDL